MKILNTILIGICLPILVSVAYSQKLPEITVLQYEKVKPFPIQHGLVTADRKVTFKLLNTTAKEIVVYGKEIEGNLDPIRYLLRFNKDLKQWEYPTRDNKPLSWKKDSPTSKKERVLKPGEYIMFSIFFSGAGDCGNSYKVYVRIKIGKSKKPREIISDEVVVEPCIE